MAAEVEVEGPGRAIRPLRMRLSRLAASKLDWTKRIRDRRQNSTLEPSAGETACNYHSSVVAEKNVSFLVKDMKSTGT